MTEQTARPGHGGTGAAVRRARAARGLSLRSLAGRVGVSPATMSALETGRTRFTVDRLRHIADVLQVPVADLLSGEAPDPAAPGATGPPGPPAGRPGGAAGDWRDHDDLVLDPVLEAAARVFVRRGFHAASMREVAAEAGLSVAGVYHHYPGKQQILLALLEVTMAEIRWRLLAAREEGQTPVESFALMVESLALFHAVRGDLAFLGASEMRGLEGADRARITGLRDEVQHLLDDQADTCVATGDFTVHDPRTACRAIATMSTSLPSWYRPDGPLTAAEVARSYAGYALAVMRPGPPPTGRAPRADA